MALAAEGHRVDLLRVPAKVHEEKGHAMALDQSALLELLEALKMASAMVVCVRPGEQRGRGVET